MSNSGVIKESILKKLPISLCSGCLNTDEMLALVSSTAPSFKIFKMVAIPNGENTKLLFKSIFPFKMVDAMIFVASPTIFSFFVSSRRFRFGELVMLFSDNKMNIPNGEK